MYALVVAVFLLVGGDPMPMGSMVYNVTHWPTKEACEAYVKSDEGKNTLANLKQYLEVTNGAEAALKPSCEKAEE